MDTCPRRLRIAFYAPLKSPDHPVPSGDRLMARMLIRCLERAGHQVEVISHLRTYLPDPGNAAGWASLQDAASGERERLAAKWKDERPDLIFCYHPYYKSPDLIGLALSRQCAVPYVTCEASWSSRRNEGVWREMQALAREGVGHAAVNLCFTARDETGLRAAVPKAQLMRLPPFIDTTAFDATPMPEPGHIVTVAMMRDGDKRDSYRKIAESLALLPAGSKWTLSVAGDGPARDAVHGLFACLPQDRIHWLGALSAERVAALLARGAIFLWPGCGEAYGLVYLEAQAAGLPVVALRTAGVPEVVSPGAGGTLTEDDPVALAGAVADLIADPARAAQLGGVARTQVRTYHSIDAASAQLADVVQRVATTGFDR